jgi:hypothetical protein
MSTQELVEQILKTHRYERFSNYFIDKSVLNEKGTSTRGRFIDIISDPSNLLLTRVPNAGTEQENYAIMFNGVKVLKGEYYGDFFDILYFNKGSHEPSEERIFSLVLEHIPEGGTMIELGSYWAFYSLSFNQKIKNAKNYCIEPSSVAMEVGKENFRLNGAIADFTEGFIGRDSGNLRVSEFIKEKGIDFVDILHSDIQGYEYEMLEDCIPLLDSQRIGYLFISTHSDELHTQCKKLLTEHNYRIICSADVETETFCFDGILVACHSSNQTIPDISLGCRKHTKLRTKPYL